MLIRVEIGIDAPGIDALLRRTFGRDAEAQLVHDLREDGLITLGVVATDDEGQVIGYVAFSPVKSCSGSVWRRWRWMNTIVDRALAGNWSMKGWIR